MTNCKNCGAPLANGRCEYCGAEYEKRKKPIISEPTILRELLCEILEDDDDVFSKYTRSVAVKALASGEEE